MKTLYELARLNVKHKRIFDAMLPEDNNSSLRKLYEIILTERELDDHSAMIAVYGRRNSVAFSRLKTRLREHLISSIILQNSSLETQDSRINESINGYRQTLISRLLVVRKSKNLGIDLAEKSIMRSIKYHATENVLLQCRMLVNHYGSAEYNKYKFNKFLAIQKKHLQIHEWEIKSEHYFLDLQRTQLNSLASVSEATIIKAKKYVDELDAVHFRSYFFALNKYKVKAAYFEYKKDYDSLLKLSETAFKDFSAPDLKSGNAIFNINLRRAWALLQAGRNKEAIDLGLKEMNRNPIGSIGWYFIAHYTLKAYLYDGDYLKAIDLITTMISNPKFSKIGETYQELFQASLGYIYLILQSGMFPENSEMQNELPDFKLYRFLNATPVFSKDKRGINVSILLMHIAFLLQRKDYNAIIDRIDSLNQYAYRYLRKDDSFRSNCMIKMVVQMAKADFNPIRTERYTLELLKQLKEVKIAGSGENIETEIIPYEVLWEIMTKAL